MIKKILLVLAGIVGVFLIYIALQPSVFTISRETEINAAPEKIFPYINNTQVSHQWMPWKDSDPGVEIISAGPVEGVGAKSSWDSEGNMGTGQAEIVESNLNRNVVTKLDYTRPMNMSQLAEVSLIPTETGTRVKWSVTGNNTFLGRVMCAFFNMDKMVGGEFEKGLSNLKKMVESSGQ